MLLSDADVYGLEFTYIPALWMCRDDTSVWSLEHLGIEPQTFHLPSCTFCLFISAARSNDALLSPFSQQACGYEVYDYSESALWFLKSSACRPASWMFVLLISSIFLSSWYVWWNARFNMFTTGFLLSLQTQIQQAVHALEVPLTQWMYS